MTAESAGARFPYRNLRGILSPIVRLQLFHGDALTWVNAYVDSGATYSIFDETVAQELEIELEKGHLILIAGLSGRTIPVYLHSVGMRVGDFQIRAVVGFSPQLGIGFNLLGRYSIFSQLQFCFNDRDHELTLTRL